MTEKRHHISPDRLYIMKGAYDYAQSPRYRQVVDGILTDIWERGERELRRDMLSWILESPPRYEE